MFNETISAQAEAGEVEAALEKELSDLEGEALTEAMDAAIGGAAELASSVAKKSNLVLATVNVHEGDPNEDGFATGHASITISRVDPAAVEQQKQAEKAAEEAKQRYEEEEAERQKQREEQEQTPPPGVMPGTEEEPS